jgi:hypothetical protein
MNIVNFCAGGTASGALGGSGSSGRSGSCSNRSGCSGHGGHSHYCQKVSFFEQIDLVYLI